MRDGFRDYIHVAVISNDFDDLPETEKLERLWSVLEHSELSDAEKLSISVILPYSPVEIS